MNLRSKIFILITVGVFLMGQWGCATGPYGYSKPEPLLEKYREQLGTIGVATGPDVPVIKIDSPPPVPTSTGPGVLERMGQGAEKSWQWWKADVLEPVTRGARSGGVAGIAVVLTLFILTVPVTIFGGLGSAIYGAFPPGEPPEYEETEAILRHTLASYPLQENFQSSFLKEARAQTSHSFVVVPEQGPQPSEGMGGQSGDNLLELSVQRIWLKRADDQEGEVNPPMVLALVVRAKLVRGPEKTVWYDETFVHETKKRPYKEWPHYHRLQTDIETAYQKLAEQLVEKLFLPKPTT